MSALQVSWGMVPESSPTQASGVCSRSRMIDDSDQHTSISGSWFLLLFSFDSKTSKKCGKNQFQFLCQFCTNWNLVQQRCISLASGRCIASGVAAVAVSSTLLLRLTYHCLRMPAARSCQLRLAIMRRDFVISTWYQFHDPCPCCAKKRNLVYLPRY